MYYEYSGVPSLRIVLYHKNNESIVQVKYWIEPFRFRDFPGVACLAA